MSQISNLSSTILNIKTNIKNAIINKGQNVNDLFSSYPNAIMNISGGSQGIKIFDSIQNMQSDINSQTGDLAIVYASTIDNITENTQFQEGTFPETVTLSTAVTDYIQLQFKAVDESIMFDCGGEIGSDYMQMSCYMDDGSGDWKEYRIEYTSSDGLTYTRTRFQINQEDISGNVMDFGILIVFGSRWGEPTWDDRIGSFIKAGTTSFEGMYKHNGTNYNWANTGLTALTEDVYKGKFYGNNVITNGTGSITTNLNINQLKNKVNLYNNLSYLDVQSNESLENLYGFRGDLITVPRLNTDNVINMSNMFRACRNLISVPNFNTSNVTNMSEMFNECQNLTSVSNFDTSRVTDMNCMFQYCNNLTTIPNFDTLNVKDMCYMFSSCYNLTTIPNFNTSNVINMSSTFAYCNNLTLIPNFDTSNVTEIMYAFQGCQNLINVPNFDTSNVINTYGMFWNCYNLTNVPNFDTNNVTNMQYMFYNCYNLTNVPNFNMSNVTNMMSTFKGCQNLTNISNFDASNVGDMASIFADCYNLTTVYNFNTGKVVDVNNMFIHCCNLTIIPNFDMSNVRYMPYMFYNCYNLTTIPNFDLSNVINMHAAFAQCYNLTTVPLLNMSNAAYITSMFDNCNNLSSSSYANIANMLPNADKLSNKFLASTGLNLQKFNSTQNTILKNKGYIEFQQNYYTVVYS